MSTVLHRLMSREAFFEWAETQEDRYEFDGEHPVLMTGGNILHSKLMGRFLLQLLAQLDAAAFEALGPDAGVSTIGNRVRYPDVVVGAGSTNVTARLVQTPIAVVEIISSSSSQTDRIVKLREYGSVSSIRHYVILETNTAAGTLLEKHLDGSWTATPLTREQSIVLPELGVTIPMTALYHGLIG